MPIIAMTKEMGSLGTFIALEVARCLDHEFLRNDIFDATGYFDGEKSKLRRNQFGSTVGGPVCCKVKAGSSTRRPCRSRSMLRV